MASGSPALLCLTHLCLPPAAKGRADAGLCPGSAVWELPAGSRESVLLLGAGQQENIESESIAGNPSPCSFLLGSLQQGTSACSLKLWDRTGRCPHPWQAPGMLSVPQQGGEGGGQEAQEDTQTVSKPGQAQTLPEAGEDPRGWDGGRGRSEPERARWPLPLAYFRVTLGEWEKKTNVASGAGIRDQGLLFIQWVWSINTSHEAQVPDKKQAAVIAFWKAFPCHVLRLLQEYLSLQMLLGM